MLQIKTLVDLFETSCRIRGPAPLFGIRQKDAFQWISYSEVHEQVARVRRLLRELGVNRGDRVAVIAENSVEWATLCYATAGCGAVMVRPAYALSGGRWPLGLPSRGPTVAM